MSRIPPWPVFTLCAFGPLIPRAILDPTFQRLDARDVGTAQIPTINPGLKLFEKLASKLQVPGDRPGLDQCLAPPGASRDIVIVQGRFVAHGHGPRVAGGANRRSTR